MYPVLLTLAALNGTVFGLLFLIAPDFTISLFGGELDTLSSLLVRQFGGVILGIAVLNWMIRNVEHRETRRAVTIGTVVAFVFVATIAAYATATGVINPLGWVVAVFHAAVAIGLVVSREWSLGPPRRR